MSEWISVKDELPSAHKYVLCYVKPTSVNSYRGIKIKWVTKRASRGIISDISWFNEVTHWMPLPEPPK